MINNNEKNNSTHKNIFQESNTRFFVTCDALVFTVQNREGKEQSHDLADKRLKVALVKRKEHLNKNEWSLPGGFVKKGKETTCQTALRKLREETTLEDIYLEQLYTWDDLCRDPREHILSVSYLGLVSDEEVSIKAGKNIEEVRWFEIKKELTHNNKIVTENGYIKKKIYEITLKNKDVLIKGEIEEVVTLTGRMKNKTVKVVNETSLAFDHMKMLNYALERLKNKIGYTDIMFNLLPEYFTIAQAHATYKLLTGKEYTNQNFRKKFRCKWVETDKKSNKYSPKPARLYKLNINWDEKRVAKGENQNDKI